MAFDVITVHLMQSLSLSVLMEAFIEINGTMYAASSTCSGLNKRTLILHIHKSKEY